MLMKRQEKLCNPQKDYEVLQLNSIAAVSKTTDGDLTHTQNKTIKWLHAAHLL